MTALASRPDRAILPPTLRAPAAAVSVLALFVFGVFAARYADDDSAGRLDRRVQKLFGASDRGLSLTDAVILLGNPVTVVVLAVLLAGLALVLGHRRLAVLAIVGPGLTGVATTTLKPVIGRTIDGGFAFPSGHTGGATAIGVVAALLLITVLRPATGTSALLLSAGALVSGGAMALALVVDRVHYPTDTVGGFCVAVAVVLTSALVIERLPRAIPRWGAR
ncbi:phosphatase PAP2 family protein [Pseudonocardia sp. DSM 110487]|uniref:phosphatase PAP2 family protein n=1 Tax=Pseudonocardia sp. DSM 110487 TaxID=2865833 RepID=UPI001C694322|nr:phosphatase PAP2 family protein [Pseudonocardia sp. DSM 110487]QYN34464.1 phosphatase PAP2 family protein [Pseudonocardia sp. DSM 110487]